MSNNLIFYVEFEVKPECIERFIQGATQVLEAMSKEIAFVSTQFHRHVDNPNKFSLYEVWNESSMDDFVKNQLHGKSYRDEYEVYLPELLASPRKFSVLNSIGSWKK
ncbi:antibiotic biosynthesis monooxygenase [Shewanella sp. Isolate13]|uniref:putative quinol monooxygenase n=1 Tax=Shewanella sp. Isolate13 TaxID=2908531 RepID=UPI001EFD0252|nr:antibiotic biosynthesis monooxygenase [Shewanella sp. Isolate13]MCG9732225.1 antibiotic biosynthesis monooxygenase [Shewanella sp. Isolate13]